MEITEAAQWALRVVLPIVLFVIYPRSNPGDEKGYSGPTGNTHTRGKMLARRKLVDGDKPAFLANLCVKSQADAPELFPAAGGLGAAAARASAARGPPTAESAGASEVASGVRSRARRSPTRRRTTTRRTRFRPTTRRLQRHGRPPLRRRGCTSSPC
ncbi:unnamed protein product [Prorocentrum cordatum]|uniref:Uncharacterized protein n=1 Tax=Prorocentrum cordatum TaxID=2364126 RepID=A0ABN9PZ86_9DINO|nr:unnamed protein product [Polarella glacialis]